MFEKSNFKKLICLQKQYENNKIDLSLLSKNYMNIFKLLRIIICASVTFGFYLNLFGFQLSVV